MAPHSEDHDTTFMELGLRPELLGALEQLGYEEPTPIQRKAIPALLSGRDVLGQAATGTGKTAAFALPMLNSLPEGKPAPFKPRALVLVPTRELAMQVAEATHTYGRGMGVSVLPVYGGQPFDQQLRRLKHGVHVVIATPGRALDHLRRLTLKLDEVAAVVVDEADEMLDLGFAEDLEAILSAVPEKAQVALFSATLPPRIVALAQQYLHDPARLEVSASLAQPKTVPKISQTAYLVPRAFKDVALGRVLDLEAPASAIIFCRTRLDVEELSDSLSGHGFETAALHGGLAQEQRDRVIRKFKAGEVQLLVATDVAARGLDVERLTHVINYDLPSAPDSYVHRIGRTGRAGREGRAITFCEPREHRYLKTLERLTGGKIELARVPTYLDLHARRLELTRVTVEEALQSEELDPYRAVVERLAASADLIDVAAAAVAALHRTLSPEKEEDRAEIPEIHQRPQAERPEQRGPKKGAGKHAPPRRSAGGGEPSRIFVGLGRSAGLRPADLVGAIANEAGVDRSAIGAIQIAERHSFVEIDEQYVDDVIEALKKTTVRGRKVKVDRDRKPPPKRAR